MSIKVKQILDRIGTWNGSVSTTSNYWFSGYIYSVISYNKILTQSEIKQNYKALKGRFEQ